jgi:hypothetical protein
MKKNMLFEGKRTTRREGKARRKNEKSTNEG